MNRRECVAAALVGATAGCLRLESDAGTSTTRTADPPESTTTDESTTDESGAERWLGRTTERVRALPTFDEEGVAFAADATDVLYALDVATGDILHEAQPFEYPMQDLAFVDGSLVVAMNGLRGVTAVRD